MLPPTYIPDNTGMFTDTAVYVDFIQECTNLSVGYSQEHTINEKQSITHLIALRDKMVKFDWTKLVADRDVKDQGDWKSFGD